MYAFVWRFVPETKDKNPNDNAEEVLRAFSKRPGQNGVDKDKNSPSSKLSTASRKDSLTLMDEKKALIEKVF